MKDGNSCVCVDVYARARVCMCVRVCARVYVCLNVGVCAAVGGYVEWGMPGVFFGHFLKLLGAAVDGPKSHGKLH